MTVNVVISSRPAETTQEISFIEDLDVLSESALCACSAGDDNPF
jgi:hypothetical protein